MYMYNLCSKFNSFFSSHLYNILYARIYIAAKLKDLLTPILDNIEGFISKLKFELESFLFYNFANIDAQFPVLV